MVRHKLRKNDREALHVCGLSESEIEAILTADLPPEAEALNFLMNDLPPPEPDLV